jgi:DNA helicase-2/ATP-dependent DNA helicase PcrA
LGEALKTGNGLSGTLEFFPEEGKYHLDGHRACGIVWEPSETKRHKGLCPVCGKPVTVGVLARVEALADRPEGVRPASAGPFRSFIPLAEILGELLGRGAATGAVKKAAETLVEQVGPELAVLGHVPLEALGRCGPPRLDEAIGRMRAEQVIRQAGFDGQYGVIRLFEPTELGRTASVRKPAAVKPVGSRRPIRCGRRDQPDLFDSVQA